MPTTTVAFFRDKDGSVPVLDWLRGEVTKRDKRVAEKCRVALKVLAQDGRDLRRPTADYLRDGIYELRIRFGRVNYRLLYFFVGDIAAVVSHGVIKEAKVPAKDIDIAVTRKALCETDWERYTYEYR